MSMLLDAILSPTINGVDEAALHSLVESLFDLLDEQAFLDIKTDGERGLMIPIVDMRGWNWFIWFDPYDDFAPSGLRGDGFTMSWYEGAAQALFDSGLFDSLEREYGVVRCVIDIPAVDDGTVGVHNARIRIALDRDTPLCVEAPSEKAVIARLKGALEEAGEAS